MSFVRKYLKTIVMAAITLCVFAAGCIIYYEIDSRKVPPLVLESELAGHASPSSVVASASSAVPLPSPSTTPPARSEEPPATIQPDPMPEPVASVNPPNTATTGDRLKAGTLTVRGKTFELKKGVDEETLKKNIGWMESSAAPGEIGTCVVMGHRNTQFRILRLVESGDIVTIVDDDGVSHTYTVESGEIIYDDKDIRFKVSDKKTLVLVTCYPFFYSGHAPYRYIITAMGC